MRPLTEKVELMIYKANESSTKNSSNKQINTDQ